MATMEIQITTKKSEGLERLLEVSVPVETVRDAEEKAARRYATQARLPGFRPGKAPTAIVKKKFAEAIRQSALETLVQDAFQEVMEREQLKPATQPHVHHVHFDEGKPLVFELHVELRPEVKLARTSGFRVKRPEGTVGEPQVLEQLDALRDQRATWTPVEEKPLPGDQVAVLLATADESGAIGDGKEYRIVIGEGQSIPAIEELILEAAPGQTVERPVKWPDDFPDEAQRGKTKSVRVTLREVKRKSMPELSDAFAREVGDFDSLDALRTAVQADLASHAERESDAQVRQQLIDEIISANPFDVPEAWVAQLSDAYMQNFQVPEQEKERFAHEFRPVAERQVRRDLVIEAIADQEGLAATEADIDERVSEVAQKRGAEPAQVYASLQKAGRLKEIERSVTEEKVFNWLRERNTVD